MRKKAQQIVALRIAGHSRDDIALLLNIKPASVNQYMYVAGKNGWLETEDPNDELEYNLAHKVVGNLDELLTHRNVLGLPDRETTLETAKGIGLFKVHDGRNDAPQQQNVLSIVIETPGNGNGNLPRVRAGTTAGVPAYVDGQTIDVDKPA